MGIISRLFRKEQRAEVLTADDRIMSILRTIEISPETAREIPAVSACIGLLSSVIAALPVKLYRDNRQENKTEEIKDDIRLRLLNDETGDMLDPFQMKKAVISDFFYYGGGYIYPEMRRNRCISLRYIPHDAISSYNGIDAIFKTGKFILTNGLELREDQVIRLLHDTKDGLKGDSFILLHQQLFTTMYREIVYEKHIVTNGGNKKGFLTSENKLDPEMLSDLRQKWNEMYANTGNTMMVLNKGLSFHESSNTSVEMQLRENKQDNNAIACQVFGLSPEAVSGRLTDDQFASTIKTAATPIITAFENALDVGLLLPSERDSYYFVLDTTELTKGDILKRYQAYKTGLECNVLQIDEARYKEDLPPLGLNWIKLGLQDVLYDPKTKMIYTPNMNQSMQMSENPVNFGEKTVDNGGEGGIIEERGKDNYIQDPSTGQMMGSTGGGGSSGGASLGEHSKKPITEITDKAIDKVPYVAISGYSEEQCKKIQEQHKELLRFARDENGNKETAFVFRKDLSDRSEVKGTDDRLDLGGSMHGKGTDLIIMHNHPRNSSYSTTDIDFFTGNTDIKTLTIVKNNGKIETLAKGNNFNLSVFQKEYNRLYIKIVLTNTDAEKDKFVKTLLSKTKSGVIWNAG